MTAERRSQRLQSVPISITAVTGEGLAKAGIAAITELAQVTPGLVSPASLSGNVAFTPFIRGIGSAAALPGIEPSVALYIDGVYSGVSFQNNIDLANIARVEILKGPQGTLYGRNATGGAINIITERPADTFGGNASFSYGRFSETVEKVYLTGPLATGLNASVAFVGRQGGDFGDNLTTGNKFGGLTSTTINAQIAWTPVDRLEIDLSGTYSRRRGRRYDDTIVNDPGSVPLGGQLGGQFSTDPNKGYLTVDPRINTRSYSGAAHVRYSADSFDLVSISAYQKGSNHTQLDPDGTSLPILAIRWSAPNRVFTQEFQAVSTSSSPFQWIVGLYYYKAHADYAPFESDSAPLPVQFFSYTSANAKAAFVQGSYQLTPSTKVTAGLRYNNEKRTLDSTLIAPTLGGAVLAPPLNLKRTFNKLTWRFSLDHKFSDDILGYVSYNRGFKSGAFNPLSTDPTNGVNPEVIDAYEVGVKSRLANRAVQLNGSFYYYKYKNIQVQQVVLGVGGAAAAALQNAAAATLYGLDADIIVAPVTGLQLIGGINLEHSNYDKYLRASGFLVVNGLGVPGSFDATGDRVLFAPDVTFNLGANYSLSLGNTGNLQFAANYSHNSRYKISAGEGNFIRAHGTLNGSIAFSDPRDRFSIEFWGRNLTDVRRYGEYTFALNNSLAIQPPRSYGVTVGAKF